MMKRFILSLAICLPVIAGCEKPVAGTTDPGDGPGTLPEDEPLTFTIEATPSTTSVSLKVTPSDNEKPYYIMVMDNSFYDAGYTDEDIMEEILANKSDLPSAVKYGVTEDYVVEGMVPGTEYIAAAFGVDLDNRTYNSEMSKQNFTTTQAQKSPAYVTASADNYWLIDDLAEYNPDYAGLLSDPNNPVLAPIDFDFNEYAESCQYILWIGDVTGANYDELYNATIEQSDNFRKEDPAPIFYVAFHEATTLCVIGIDADGNYGEMYKALLTFTEEGKSDDYALFDEYYNRAMGNYSMTAAAGTNSRPAGICLPRQFTR